ncbi:hypothetical protein SAMN05661080_02708 [Modestobacter sp. DSM 44400]|nr:hypothetical protein SAMN05661080_02708 [Modestobacter sp. DSM 44400]
MEDKLLVVNPAGTPVPLSAEALEAAPRRGEGETVAEHDRAERATEGRLTMGRPTPGELPARTWSPSPRNSTVSLRSSREVVAQATVQRAG